MTAQSQLSHDLHQQLAKALKKAYDEPFDDRWIEGFELYCNDLVTGGRVVRESMLFGKRYRWVQTPDRHIFLRRV